MIYLLSLIVSMGWFSTVHGTDADLPLSHPIYDVLDRLEARGHIASTLPGIRPYPVSFIAKLTHDALQRPGLSRAEQASLGRFLIAYDTRPNPSPLRSGRAYAYSDSALSIDVRPLARQQVLSIRDPGDEDLVSVTRLGLGVEGTFHDRFSFRMQHIEGREWSNIPRTSAADVHTRPLEAVQLKGKTVDFRESRYQLLVRLPWFDLDFGKQAFDWGPSREANLGLHHAGPSFVYGRLRATHKALTFEHVFGALRTSPDDGALGSTAVSNGHRRTLPPHKRLVTHRLELALSPRITVGVHESVVYGDRSFEPAYVIPIAPLVGAQSYAGDTDNLTFGFDLSVRAAPTLKLYSAAFFDDLQKFTPGSFSNQFGVQVGGHWASPFGLNSTDIRAEYVHIEPYTYAHNFDINAYTHFRATLGHPLGPNADRILIRGNWWASNLVRVTLEGSKSREGDNYLDGDDLINVGGDATQGRRPSDASERSFLSGDRTRTYRLDAGILVAPTAALRLRLGYGYQHRKFERAIDGPEPGASSHRFVLSSEFNAF